MTVDGPVNSECKLSVDDLRSITWLTNVKNECLVLESHDSFSRQFHDDNSHNRHDSHRLAGHSGEHSRNSLVPPNPWSMVERFFRRPNLRIGLAGTSQRIDENRSKLDLFFTVMNVGRNTAANVRAVILTGERAKTPLPTFDRLSWVYPESDEKRTEVDLPYLGEARAILLSGVLQSKKETGYQDYSLDGKFLAKVEKDPVRIADVYLLLFGEGGFEKRHWIWLLATGDLAKPFTSEVIPQPRLWFLHLLAQSFTSSSKSYLQPSMIAFSPILRIRCNSTV